MQVTREAAEKILKAHTKSPSILRHSRAVEVCMRWYAKHYGLGEEEIELWGATGLLHRCDYEKNPLPMPPDGHPYGSAKILQEQGYPEDMVAAILAHENFTNMPRKSMLAKVLYSVVNLTDLVIACVHATHSKDIRTINIWTVVDKFDEASFLEACNRDDIRQGAEGLEISIEEHTGNVIDALSSIAQELELDGSQNKVVLS